MLSRVEGLGGNVVALRATGLVTAEDYRTVLAPGIEAAARHGGRVRLLLEMGEGFEGYDPGAMVADAMLGVGHLGSFERIAVITDAEWLRRAIHLFGGLIPGEVRLFKVAAAADARAWIAG